MVKPTRWEIILGNNIFLHMDVISQREHSVIFDAIEQQLSYEVLCRPATANLCIFQIQLVQLGNCAVERIIVTVFFMMLMSKPELLLS
ncbi:MAG: hypothetical protein DYG89_52660 [Caldilinea sp. CFX5]|nr:hypothetical protein [Caldilinea sp. CFX5]